MRGLLIPSSGLVLAFIIIAPGFVTVDPNQIASWSCLALIRNH
jgi:hypothetical protein